MKGFLLWVAKFNVMFPFFLLYYYCVCVSQSAASLQSSTNSAQPAEGRGSQIQTQMEALGGKMPSLTLPDAPSINKKTALPLRM